MSDQLAAILASIILFGIAIFQILLVLGLPLGEYAWGGKYRVLPKNLRISSIFSTLIYGFAAAIILDRAKVISLFEDGIHKYGIWVLTGFFASGIILNGISRSKKERMVMTPVVFSLTILCLITAMNK